MDSNRTTAVTAGMLFVVATLASLAGSALYGPMPKQPPIAREPGRGRASIQV